MEAIKFNLKRLQHSSTVFVFVIMLSVFTYFYSIPYETSDTMWSTFIGNWIISHRQIPQVDYWTWTFYGKHWTAEEWLFEVLFAWLNHFGFKWIVFFSSIISALTYTILAAILKFKQVKYPALWSISVGLLSLPYSQLRAQLFSYLFFAIMMLILTKDRKKPTKWLFALIPMQLLWTNLHGSFVIGLAAMEWEMFTTLFSFRWQSVTQSQEKHRLKRLFITDCLMTITTFINPFGWKLYEFVIWLSVRVHISQFITEWQPPTINDLYSFLTLGLVGLALLIKWNGKDQLLNLRETVWLFFWMVMSLRAIRFVPYFLLTLPVWVGNSSIQTNNRLYSNGLKLVARKGLLLGCLLLSLKTVIFVHGNVATNATAKLNPPSVAYVENELKQHPNWRLWNTYNLGGTLENDGVRVSIEGRTDLYLPKGMEDYKQIVLAMPGAMDTFQKKYNSDVVVIEKTAPFVELLKQNQWKQVFTDEWYVVYEKGAI